MNNRFQQKKIGFLGIGNMSQAILRALIEKKILEPSQVLISNRTPAVLDALAQSLGVTAAKNNEEVLDQCDIIFLGVKPQDLAKLLEPLTQYFSADHIVISMAAGITLQKLQKALPSVAQLVRIMPNTPAKIHQAVVGYCLAKENFLLEEQIKHLMSPLGYVVKLEEGEKFEALTVSCGSGVAFIFEMMQYWQAWIEDRGISASVAKEMTVQTFMGAALLAAQSHDLSLAELQSQVVSKKGVSYAGLESMRQLSLENILSSSFEKAVLRDRELSLL